LYRLASPREGELTATEYVSEDGKRAVVFAAQDQQQYGRMTPPVVLRGLDEKGVYKVTAVNEKLMDKQPSLSGAYLMQNGLRFNLKGDYDASAVVLERVN